LDPEAFHTLPDRIFHPKKCAEDVCSSTRKPILACIIGCGNDRRELSNEDEHGVKLSADPNREKEFGRFRTESTVPEVVVVQGAGMSYIQHQTLLEPTNQGRHSGINACLRQPDRREPRT
jgi:hypothetical protein